MLKQAEESNSGTSDSPAEADFWWKKQKLHHSRHVKKLGEKMARLTHTQSMQERLQGSLSEHRNLFVALFSKYVSIYLHTPICLSSATN